MNFPHISKINEHESLYFFGSSSEAFPCAFCARRFVEPAFVRSGGMRVDVFYSREPVPVRTDNRLVADPICWVCIQNKAHGSKGSNQEWRTATARFLNALHELDPLTYYCGIRSLD